MALVVLSSERDGLKSTHGIWNPLLCRATYLLNLRNVMSNNV